MAIIPKLLIDPTINVNVNGYYIRITDVTGVFDATSNPGGYGGSNPAKATITKTRVKLNRYNDIMFPENIGENNMYIKYLEYKNTGIPYLEFDLNGNAKYAKSNSAFIPFNSGSVVPSGGTAVTTGNILVLPNWDVNLTDNQLITNSEFLLSTDEKFPDDVYSLQWDLFQNTNTVSLVNNLDYIVGGTADPVIIYANSGSPNVYGLFGENEVFTASSNNAWSVDNGAPQVFPKVATTTYSFLVYNQSQKYVREISMRYAQKKCKCSTDFDIAFREMQTKYQALLVMVLPSGVQIQSARILIQEIENIYNSIINTYCY